MFARLIIKGDNKIKEEYWLKFGFKENGDLTCVRAISESKPTENFFYTENGEYKEVREANVVQLTKEIIEKINSINSIGVDKS